MLSCIIFKDIINQTNLQFNNLPYLKNECYNDLLAQNKNRMKKYSHS